PKRHIMEIVERRQVETVNRPCLSYGCPASRGAVMQRKESKTLPTPVLSRAGAHRAAEPISKVRPDAEEILRLVLARLEDKKAEHRVPMAHPGNPSIADTRVGPPGGSTRHVGSVADRVLEDLATAGLPDARVEGMPHCDWVLIDAGDVIVHVFRPEVRAFYNLEKMWAPVRPHGRRAS